MWPRMAQLTLYIPDDLEADLREGARRAGKSVSAYVVDLTRRSLRPACWPEGFAELGGSWEGEFPAIQDPPPEPVEPL